MLYSSQTWMKAVAEPHYLKHVRVRLKTEEYVHKDVHNVDEPEVPPDPGPIPELRGGREKHSGAGVTQGRPLADTCVRIMEKHILQLVWPTILLSHISTYLGQVNYFTMNGRNTGQVNVVWLPGRQPDLNSADILSYQEEP